MHLLYRHRRLATAMTPRPAAAWGSPIQACADHGRDSRVGRIWAKAEWPNDGISTEGRETTMLSFLRRHACDPYLSEPVKKLFLWVYNILYICIRTQVEAPKFWEPGLGAHPYTPQGRPCFCAGSPNVCGDSYVITAFYSNPTLNSSRTPT